MHRIIIICLATVVERMRCFIINRTLYKNNFNFDATTKNYYTAKKIETTQKLYLLINNNKLRVCTDKLFTNKRIKPFKKGYDLKKKVLFMHYKHHKYYKTTWYSKHIYYKFSRYAIHLFK